MGTITWRAPHFAVLLSWPRHLEEGEEAERVPVQVAVRAQAGPLGRRGSAWWVGEAQVVLHLWGSRGQRKRLLKTNKKNKPGPISKAKANVISAAPMPESTASWGDLSTLNGCVWTHHLLANSVSVWCYDVGHTVFSQCHPPTQDLKTSWYHCESVIRNPSTVEVEIMKKTIPVLVSSDINLRGLFQIPTLGRHALHFLADAQIKQLKKMSLWSTK